MCRRVPLQFIAMVMVFTFCQVIGAMCVLPDLSAAEETAILVEETMACPMDGTIMCPPSVTSSPERDVKPGGAVDLDQIPELPGSIASFPVPQASSPWSWSSASSIVPISIASSSVLRI